MQVPFEPRVHFLDVYTKPGVPIHITPFSDLHLDDSLCDLKSIRRVADARRDLPNHYAFSLGDTLNLVVPPDLKRWRPSVQADGIAGRDDWLNATVEYGIEQLEKLNLKWALFIPGNHEDEFCKRYGFDSTSVLAKHFKAARGGYSGALDVRIHLDYGKAEGNNKPFVPCRIIWHHGAWGGRLSKGYIGAKDFAFQHDGWHFFLYGHNHHSRHDPEIRRRIVNDRIEEYECHIVNCSAAVHNYGENALETHYAERHGYTPQRRKPPLLRITTRLYQGKREMETSVEY